MRRAAFGVAVLLFVGCGAGPEPEPEALTESTPAASGATRAEREAATASAAPGATAPAIVPAVEVPVPAIQLSRLDGSAEAEDGAGHVAASERAVAIDLRSADFPPRALDPVLVIGALRLHHYRHPRIGVLRFVVASPELLEDGAAVAVDYEDGAAPTVVTPSLLVPAEVRR